MKKFLIALPLLVVALLSTIELTMAANTELIVGEAEETAAFERSKFKEILEALNDSYEPPAAIENMETFVEAGLVRIESNPSTADQKKIASHVYGELDDPREMVDSEFRNIRITAYWFVRKSGVEVPLGLVIEAEVCSTESGECADPKSYDWEDAWGMNWVEGNQF